jgi:GTP-binding protein HflX
LHPIISSFASGSHTGAADPEAAQAEFNELALSAGLEVVAEVKAPRHQPDPSTLVGSGKVEEIKALVSAHEIGVVLVNARLSPIQERNLTRALDCAVVDRTRLILDIFAQRAASHEGKLQVELAQLRHLATRLIRGWTHLERQRGGIGMRGPGETQLETDRRLLAARIRQLESKLARVAQRRSAGRRARSRSSVPLVALVGYTNAGKSTLFNRLTEASIYTQDQLFATLDPTVRRIKGSSGTSILVSDTVGFIRDLPHELVAAFRSTLEETLAASLIVHVIDASDPDHHQHEQVVRQVLEDIGADDLPVLKVFNKVDQTELEPGAHCDETGQVESVWVSALDGRGMDALQQAIESRLSGGRIRRRIQLPAAGQRLRARLFDLGAVQSEQIADDGSSWLEIDMDQRDTIHLRRLGGADGKLVRQLLLN